MTTSITSVAGRVNLDRPGESANAASRIELDRPGTPSNNGGSRVDLDRPGAGGAGAKAAGGGHDLLVRPIRDRGDHSYTVVRGDCLWDIAKAHLHAGATDSQTDAEWHRWYAANRSTVGTNPDLILPGQVFTPPRPDLPALQPFPTTAVPPPCDSSVQTLRVPDPWRSS